jgi:hypothetical protein
MAAYEQLKWILSVPACDPSEEWIKNKDMLFFVTRFTLIFKLYSMQCPRVLLRT